MKQSSQGTDRSLMKLTRRTCSLVAQSWISTPGQRTKVRCRVQIMSPATTTLGKGRDFQLGRTRPRWPQERPTYRRDG
jgi:hypothetical protein